jgi:hypothetical protein
VYALHPIRIPEKSSLTPKPYFLQEHGGRDCPVGISGFFILARHSLDPAIGRR